MPPHQSHRTDHEQEKKHNETYSTIKYQSTAVPYLVVFNMISK